MVLKPQDERQDVQASEVSYDQLVIFVYHRCYDAEAPSLHQHNALHKQDRTS